MGQRTGMCMYCNKYLHNIYLHFLCRRLAKNIPGDTITGIEIMKLDFDNLIANEEYNGILTNSIEKNINEVKEKLKSSFNEESAYYTNACHYLDKAFEEYIDNKDKCQRTTLHWRNTGGQSFSQHYIAIFYQSRLDR